MRQDTGRRFRHTRCLSLICATVCLTVACVPQSIRSTFSRSADSAASDTVLLEPGIPPVEPLEWTLPLRIAKKSQRTSPAEEESFNVEDEQPTLRMDGAISVYPDVWARNPCRPRTGPSATTTYRPRNRLVSAKPGLSRPGSQPRQPLPALHRTGTGETRHAAGPCPTTYCGECVPTLCAFPSQRLGAMAVSFPRPVAGTA